LWTEQDTVDLGNSVMLKRRYYLDTKYWIYLREASQGRGTKSQQEIHHSLNSLAESGTALCPISYQSYIELRKQSDRQSLLATAQIMDKLSGKVCFIPFNAIFQQELACYVRSRQLTQKGLPAVSASKYVWTKTPYLFGDFILQLPEAPAGAANLVGKQFQESWKDLGLFDLMSMTSTTNRVFQNAGLAEQLNTSKDLNQNWTSFEQICLVEIERSLELFEEETKEVLRDLSKTWQLNCPQTPFELSQVVIREWKEKGMVTGLPHLSIRCLMHSFMRYNRTQRFKTNDITDFGHAAWAIPYCDAFFTERSLANMATNNLLKLDQRYNTRILWEEEQVLDFLKLEMQLREKQ